MELQRIKTVIKQIEEINDQSVSFIIHEDGSGQFQDFWNNNMCEINQTGLRFNDDKRLGPYMTLNRLIDFIDKEYQKIKQ